ncbi:MAG: hypothetical protein MJ065_05110 [Oscillospiraceae bacterium]|nr:hypothetical protein [Oscillospiraceae bacterium]
MAIKLPQQDRIGKMLSLIQLIIFVVLFLAIYLLLRRVVHLWILRILILLLDYAAVSMIVYVVIRPLFAKIEERIRKK